MEFYLLDSTYKCKRPAQYQYLSKALGHNPFPKVHCNSEVLYPFVTTSGIDIRKLNIDHIREIHYLLADSASSFASMWGHSMFRILICDPKQSTQQCRLQRKNSLVLNFSAFLPNFTVDAFKGLTGQYESTLSFSDFNATIVTGTHIENRNVYSYPLNLSDEEKRLFTNLAIQKVWNYIGDYKFLSNNCSDEALDFFKAITSSNRLENEYVLTPTELRDLLIDKEYIDTSKNYQIYLAEKGKRIDSFNTINQLIPQSSYNFDDFIKFSNKRREELYDTILSSADYSIISHILLIERWLFINNYQEMENIKLNVLLSELQKDKREGNIALSVHHNLTRPFKSYGIPLSMNVFSNHTEASMNELFNSVDQAIFTFNEDEINEHLELIKKVSLSLSNSF